MSSTKNNNNKNTQISNDSNMPDQKRVGTYFIMPLILMATLPQMGFISIYPRMVVYAPEELCGIGIMHL